MQAVKDKIKEISSIRKAKAEAKEQEKDEKELANAKKNIAKEVRKAKEAEEEMDIHIAKAGKIAEKEMAKHATRIQHLQHD
ncbi:unnamed protein product [Amaranthus hypochondriacus]